MSDAPRRPRARTDAYFTASFEVARRLADGRGAEAIEVLRTELRRLGRTGEETGRRFLLSQIAICHARMKDAAAARHVLEEMEDVLPADVETSLMLAEGYLHLLGNHERAAHHAALALQWTEEQGQETPETLSRAQTLIARALVASGDLTGALGAWEASPLPDWRVAVKLLEAGLDRMTVRTVLVSALPRHLEHERQRGAAATARSERIRRVIAWIDAGCPKTSSRSP